MPCPTTARRFLPACLASLFAALFALIWSPAEAAFPPAERVVVNVRNFGAKGDGVADDTQAVLAAIASLPPFDLKAPFQTNVIYFPAGTYLVSDTLSRRDKDQRPQPGLVLIGASRQASRIRLRASASGFGDAGRPKALIYTASGLLGGSPYAGGKRYAELGEGNDAYQNVIESLSIEVGPDNAGAIAIDFLANNIGAIRDVGVTSLDSGAHTGISMVRKWIGPALIENVDVTGFAYGLDIANNLYSVTVDRLSVKNARSVAIRNTNNVLTLTNFDLSTPNASGIQSRGDAASLVALRGTIHSGRQAPVIMQGGVGVMKGVSGDAPGRSAGGAGPLDGVYVRGAMVGRAEWSLPPAAFPAEPSNAEIRWVDVRDFGDVANDATAALRGAFASGASGIFLPPGLYRVSSDLSVPPHVRIIDGLFSTIAVSPGAARRSSEARALFTVQKRSDMLFLRRLNLRNDGPAPLLMLRDNGGAGTSIRDVTTFASGLAHRTPAGGPIYVSNVNCGLLHLEGSKGAWVRQFNTEGKGVRIRNDGSPLWLLGFKTEQQMTLLDNRAGAVTELIGGFVYMVRKTGPSVPFIVNSGGELKASFVEQAVTENDTYDVLVQSGAGQGGASLNAKDLPVRGRFGRFVPYVSVTDNGINVTQ